jgi:predicted phage terminase large subunit-like protein
MPESGDYFKQEWIRYYDTAPPRDEMRTYGASDCAVSANGGDFTVHLVAGLDPSDDLYLLDLWRDRTSSDVWVEAQLDLIAWWKTLDWGEEKGQIAKGVGPFMTKRAIERRIYCHRRQFPSVADKSVRAQAIRGRMGMGKVYFPRRAPWTATLIAELLRFPAGTYDDQVDALGLLGMMLDRAAAGTRPKQKEEARCMNQMTFDEVLTLCGPGGRYGRDAGGGQIMRIP